MKEITRISLAALPYNIEVTAKKDLEKYLHDVEAALGANADAMKEIESRIAELLGERGVTSEKVITSEDTAAIKAQLGEPKDFADEQVVDELDKTTLAGAGTRRLMRDTNNQIVGGVCSGLAAYTRVDTVWVRLGMVLLTFATSGVMLLIYIIMWIIMPPARTAAERLQMQGKPVTLEAIQEESVVVAKQNDQHNTVMTVLRIMAGIGLLVVAVAAVMGLVAFGYHVTVDPNARLATTQERTLFATLLAAGVAFVIFCVTIARALFINQYTKRFWITLGVLTLIGIGFFSTGVLGYGVLHSSIVAENERSQVTAALDATQIAGAKSLVIDSDNALVNYIATTDTPRVELRYNSRMTGAVPSVKIDRTGDTVAIKAAAQQPTMCMGYCQGLVTVAVYGPALETLRVQTGSVRYETNGQEALTLDMKKGTDVSFVGTKEVKTLTGTVEEANLATTDANIVNVDLKIDSAASIALGNVATVNITAPETCSSGDTSNVSISNAKTVKINGTVVTDMARQAACMNFSMSRL